MAVSIIIELEKERSLRLSTLVCMREASSVEAAELEDGTMEKSSDNSMLSV